LKPEQSILLTARTMRRGAARRRSAMQYIWKIPLWKRRRWGHIPCHAAPPCRAMPDLVWKKLNI